MSESIHFAEHPALPSAEICTTADACYLEKLEDDKFYTESLDESVSSQLDMMNFAANVWEGVGKNVSVYINNERNLIEAQSIQFGASRNDRRFSDRSRESMLGQKVAQGHNRALSAVSGGILADVYVENLVAEGAPPKEVLIGLMDTLLKSHNDRIQNKHAPKVFAIEDELTSTFQFEFLVRACMQSINEEAPDVLQAIFDPSTLSDLPVDLQRVAALDIKRGKGASVLLDNAHKYAPSEQDQSSQLADYIKANNLPENVKKSLSTLKLGMQVMGAPTCPFNDLGICTHMLSRLPVNEFPDEIQRDMLSREKVAAQKRVESLAAFAKRHQVSKILDSTVQLTETVASSATQSKKRMPSLKLERRDFTLVDSPEVVTPTFTQVKFRFANSAEVYQSDTKADEIELLSEELLEQKLLSKYLDTYHDGKLEEMVAGALMVMALAPTFIGTNRMITPWLEKKNKAHINEDGVRERYMRYSGANAIGISGGPIGKATRIIFSHGTEAGVRHITIHKIINKADVKSTATLK